MRRDVQQRDRQTSLFPLFGRRRKPVRDSSRHRRRLRFGELLEDRRMLAVFTVENLNDSGAGSLRDAVSQSNLSSEFDTIDLTGVSGQITLTSGQLELRDGVQINGPGSNQLTISGNNSSRVLFLQSTQNTDFQINGLTIANGLVADEGAGLRMAESSNRLFMNGVVLRDNEANGGGGALLTGVFNIENSAFINNTATFAGAAAQISAGGNGWIVNSTISGNQSGNGFSTLEQIGSGTTENFTRLRNVTLVDNVGGGLSNVAFDDAVNTFEIVNSIFARNSGVNFDVPASTIISNGGNITDQAFSDFDGAGDFVGDPVLGPLTDDGVLIPFHSILPNSPAIDRGINARATNSSAVPFATDVRGDGFPRLIDGNGDGDVIIDAGSFEAPMMTPTFEGELTPPISVDIDQDGTVGQSTDATLAIRSIAGFTGATLTQDAVAAGGNRTSTNEIDAFLNSSFMRTFLDLDGDGDVLPLSDGILFARAIAGRTGQDLVDGAVTQGSSRSAEDIVELVTAFLNYGDAAVAPRGSIFQVAVDGLLANDPPDAAITASDVVSARGAVVSVAADGSFTYDPTGVDELNAGLQPFQIVGDSFNYTITFAGQSVVVPVTINVIGQRNVSRLFQANEDTPIERETGTSLLTAGPGNPRVVGSDATSQLGATVEVFANGEYRYDPTTSTALNGMAAGETLIDTFTYELQTDSSGPTTIAVNVEVSGRNDSPQIDDFELSDFADSEIAPKPPRIEYLDSVLTEVGPIHDSGVIHSFNPFELSLDSFIRDADLSDSHEITVDTTSTKANVSVSRITGRRGSPDQFLVRYDASQTQEILDLPFLTPVVDTFDVIVTDSAGVSDRATVTVNLLNGTFHAPVAVDDVYPLPGGPPIIAGQIWRNESDANGLHRNDGVLDPDTGFFVDLDGDRIESADARSDERFRITSDRGAGVFFRLFGGFWYEPDGPEFEALAPGETLTDTFRYRIDDEMGDGEALGQISEATVTLTVTGAPERNPVVFQMTAGTDVRVVTNRAAGLNRIEDLNTGAMLAEYPFGTTRSILIQGSDQADTIDAFQFDPRGVERSEGSFQQIKLTILAGDGDDTVVGGSEVDGGEGDDTITGDDRPNVLRGGPGEDTIDGKAGSDQIFGGSNNDNLRGGQGDDEIFGEGGDDELNGDGDDDRIRGGTGNDALIGGLGFDSLFGEGGVDRFTDLATGERNDFDRSSEYLIPPLKPLGDIATADDLSGASADPRDPDELRVTFVSSAAVTLTGPTGYGMQLLGDWTVENSSVADRFIGTNVTITTRSGGIPISLGPLPLVINTKPDAAEQTGFIASIDPLSLVTESNWFNVLSSITGLTNASLPSFGIALGSELKTGAFQDQDAPLNNAVPYLFFASGSGGGDSLEFGGMTISASGPGAGSGNEFFMAIDPSDLSIWVKGVTSEGSIALGYSDSGYIPFTPRQTPEAITNQASNKNVFGNLYGGGDFSIGSSFGLNGELVLDLNRNVGPGTNLELTNTTSNTFTELFDGIGSFDLEQIGNVFTNIELGVNGELSYTADIQSIVEVEVPLAEASLMYVDGNLIALRGAVPQDGIGFLNSYGIDVSLTATIDGFVEFDTGDFLIEIKAAAGGGIGGFRADGNFRLTLNNQFIDAELTARVPFAGSLELAGRVNWATGVFFINGKADVTLAVFKTQMSFDLRNSAAQPDQVVLNAAAKLDYTWDSFLGKYGVEANFDTRISVGGDSLFEFDGGASGTIFWGPAGTTTLGIRIGNSGFTLELPIIGDIEISFPRSLHGDMDATFAQIGSASSSQPTPLLSPVDIPAIVDEAIARMVAGGLTSTQSILLRDVQFHVTRLDNRRQELAYAAGNVVWIDSDAAGHGWFVDPTPSDDSEFENPFDAAHRESATRMDLLSTLMHELTHVLETEYPDQEFHFGEIGDEFLSPGQRFEVTQ